jgi:hypothetical protein
MRVPALPSRRKLEPDKEKSLFRLAPPYLVWSLGVEPSSGMD